MTDAQIDRLRREKWVKFRTNAGMDDDAPFRGDPMREYVEEQLDALNYLDVAFTRAKLANDTDQMKVLSILAACSRQALYLITVASSPIIGPNEDIQRDSKVIAPN